MVFIDDKESQYFFSIVCICVVKSMCATASRKYLRYLKPFIDRTLNYRNHL